MAATAMSDFRDEAGRLIVGEVRSLGRFPDVQAALEGAEGRDFREFKRELRRLEKRRHAEDVAEAESAEFLRSEPGYPLGHGMPLGGSLRADGQSHREAWASLMRADPCSYCGRSGGTVDHIEPRARGGRDVWLNYTGACEPCNGSKSNAKLLEWLVRRPVMA